jgi:hypothetical protein
MTAPGVPPLESRHPARQNEASAQIINPDAAFHDHAAAFVGGSGAQVQWDLISPQKRHNLWS